MKVRSAGIVCAGVLAATRALVRAYSATIPQPNGGSSHNGAFVHYAPDWTAELLSDTNGFYGSALEVKLELPENR